MATFILLNDSQFSATIWRNSWEPPSGADCLILVQRRRGRRQGDLQTCCSSEMRVLTFLYLWYSTPSGSSGGGYSHWNHTVLPHWTEAVNNRYEGMIGTSYSPEDGNLHSPYYPAGGPYSSDDPAKLKSQMLELQSAGVDVAVASWWGRPGVSSADSQGTQVRVCEEQSEELRRRVYWTTTYMADTSLCYIILTLRFAPRLTAPRFARRRRTISSPPFCTLARGPASRWLFFSNLTTTVTVRTSLTTSTTSWTGTPQIAACTHSVIELCSMFTTATTSLMTSGGPQ